MLGVRGFGTRMTTDRFLKKLKFQPNIRMVLGNNEAISDGVLKTVFINQRLSLCLQCFFIGTLQRPWTTT
jgi:hypothetical protein